MRRFIRHPTDIPIQVVREDSATAIEAIRDISRGGLCFQYHKPLATGEMVCLKIALTEPVFETHARVIWCQPEDGAWQVGVEFLDPDDQFRVRMVEQVCHIEQYRREQYDRSGRQLTSHEAALEWIEKFAKTFPRSDGF
jgi:Tfp pilus assembly protein PilZ